MLHIQGVSASKQILKLNGMQASIENSLEVIGVQKKQEDITKLIESMLGFGCI